MGGSSHKAGEFEIADSKLGKAIASNYALGFDLIYILNLFSGLQALSSSIGKIEPSPFYLEIL